MSGVKSVVNKRKVVRTLTSEPNSTGSVGLPPERVGQRRVEEDKESQPAETC